MVASWLQGKNFNCEMLSARDIRKKHSGQEGPPQPHRSVPAASPSRAVRWPRPLGTASVEFVFLGGGLFGVHLPLGARGRRVRRSYSLGFSRMRGTLVSAQKPRVPMFIAALFTAARTWEPPMSSGHRMGKL